VEANIPVGTRPPRRSRRGQVWVLDSRPAPGQIDRPMDTVAQTIAPAASRATSCYSARVLVGGRGATGGSCGSTPAAAAQERGPHQAGTPRGLAAAGSGSGGATDGSGCSPRIDARDRPGDEQDHAFSDARRGGAARPGLGAQPVDRRLCPVDHGPSGPNPLTATIALTAASHRRSAGSRRKFWIGERGGTKSMSRLANGARLVHKVGSAPSQRARRRERWAWEAIDRLGQAPTAEP